MHTEPHPNEAAITQTLVMSWIVGGALVCGALVFAAIVLLIETGEPLDREAVLSFIGAGFAVVMVIARQIVVGVMGGRKVSGLAGSVPYGPAGLYLIRLIIGFVPLQFAAFFNLLAYLVEGQWWGLGIVAALLGWIIASLPTRARLRKWIQDRQQLENLGPGEAI